jgi:hypothetical protein
VSFNDEIEMEDQHKSHEKKDDSDSDSDGVNFISIKVTSADGSIHDEPISESGDVKQRRAVQISESPPKFDDHHDTSSFTHHPSKVESPFQEFGKIFFLAFIWTLMMFFLASTPEKKIQKRQLAIPIHEPKFYYFPKPPSSSVQFTLQAPFLPDPKEYTRRGGNRSVVDTRNKDNTMVVYLRADEERILTPNKTFYIHKPEDFDFVNSTKLEFTLDIGEDNFYDLQEDETEVIQVVILTNFSKTKDEVKQEVPIIFSVDYTPINKPIGVLFAAFTLILLYALIVWEVSEEFKPFFLFVQAKNRHLDLGRSQDTCGDDCEHVITRFVGRFE